MIKRIMNKAHNTGKDSINCHILQVRGFPGVTGGKKFDLLDI